MSIYINGLRDVVFSEFKLRVFQDPIGSWNAGVCYLGRTYTFQNQLMPYNDSLPYNRYHPNDKGNAKLAKKMHEELVREL